MIAWDEAGSGAPTIVFVHGLSEDRVGWEPIIGLLADRFRCVRLDLRGHGESGDPPDGDFSSFAMVGDVAAVVAEAGIASEAEPPLVVGHSLGAVVATMYAAGAPVRGVVNVDQALRFDDFAAALRPVAEELRGPEFEVVFPEILDSLGIDGVEPRTAARLDELHANARQDVVMGVWGAILDMPSEELAALTDPVLASIDVPYLAIHGNEPGPDYELWLSNTIPSATLEVWGRGGHYPHLADPERFAARIARFLGT